MLTQRTPLPMETNVRLCDCGSRHDYAVIDKNVVWYCATSDDYFVYEPILNVSITLPESSENV